MKKTLLLISILSFAFNGISAQTFSGGTGTLSDPYLISSKTDMVALATAVNGGNKYSNKYFLLTQNLTEISTIIGTAYFEKPFSGIFDGGGHTIRVNIYTTGRDAGIFGNIERATIKNLGVEGSVSVVNSTARAFAGGICGEATGSTISNCYNTANISATQTGSLDVNNSAIAAAGGICGSLQSGSILGKITNCYSTGTVYTKSASNSTNFESNAGGIVGRTIGAEILNCIVHKGNITALKNTANSETIGRITSGRYPSLLTIQNCYTISTIKLNGSIVGSQDANNVNGKDEVISSFQSQQWIKENLGWDFDNIWGMSAISSIYEGLPIFRSQSSTTGAENVKASSANVIIYPNPTKDIIFIQTDELIKRVELYNSNGIMVKSQQSGKELNISHLPPSIYFLSIYVNNNTIIKKIVKQ